MPLLRAVDVQVHPTAPSARTASACLNALVAGGPGEDHHRPCGGLRDRPVSMPLLRAVLVKLSRTSSENSKTCRPSCERGPPTDHEEGPGGEQMGKHGAKKDRTIKELARLRAGPGRDASLRRSRDARVQNESPGAKVAIDRTPAPERSTARRRAAKSSESGTHTAHPTTVRDPLDRERDHRPAHTSDPPIKNGAAHPPIRPKLLLTTA